MRRCRSQCHIRGLDLVVEAISCFEGLRSCLRHFGQLGPPFLIHWLRYRQAQKGTVAIAWFEFASKREIRIAQSTYICTSRLQYICRDGRFLFFSCDEVSSDLSPFGLEFLPPCLFSSSFSSLVNQCLRVSQPPYFLNTKQ